MTKYQKFCKPTMAEALNSVGLDKSFHRAKEQYLYYYDQQQNEHKVLDMLGGYGAVLLGHNHTALKETAITGLQDDVAFHNQFSLRSGAAELAEMLNPILQRETSWKEDFICAFASTGAESVEVAIKHAEFSRGRKLDYLNEQMQQAVDKIKGELVIDWQLEDELSSFEEEFKQAQDKLAFISSWNQTALNRSPIFIALKHAFHGKLNTSIQLTHGDMYRQPFRRMGMDCRFYEPQQLDKNSLINLLNEEQAFLFLPRIRGGIVTVEKVPYPLIGAILVEPVQGEGGVYSLNKDDSQALHFARKFVDCPLIADEVQSGCGRCGTFLAGSQIDLKPDYIVLSKALGGGIAKIGLVAIRESQFASGFDLLQSSTFGEDDMSSRVAMEFVRQLESGNVLDQVTTIGHTLKSQLQKLQFKYPDIITEIRGKGLILGIVIKDQVDALSVLLRSTAYQNALGYLFAGHLLVKHNIRVAPPASAGNVIRLEPNICLTEQDITDFINAFELLCLALRYQDTGYILHYLLADADDLLREPQDFRQWYQQVLPDHLAGEADYKVAFINHLISSDWLTEVDPSLARLTSAQCRELLDRISFDRRVAPFPPVRIKSKTGETVDFTLYPINATSEQIGELIEKADLEKIRAAVDERLAAARDDGCKIAGLGMFTSIITNNGKAVETSGIKLTTGNALTVAMAAEAIQIEVEKRQNTVKCAAIIGAAGNIASVYSTLISEYCSSLILIGSGREGSVKRVLKTAYLVYQTALTDLFELGDQATGLALALAPYAEAQHWLSSEQLNNKKIGEIIYNWFEQYQPENQFIKVSESLEPINQADLLVCAANASDAFIDAKLLKNKAIVCDIAVPHNLSEQALAQRPDIVCLRGGIVQTPHLESLDLRARAYLNQGEVYACMAETIVMGLEKYTEHYSYGNISKAQVKHILARATAHGLSLSGSKQTESM